MTTMHSSDARAAYQSNSIATAAPAQLLVMLFDRLVLDVERGVRAQMASDWQEANNHLQHAQAIVTHLQSTLDTEGWTGGPELMALYAYVQRRLIQANVRRDQRAGRECVALTRHLRDTWKRAAELAAARQ